MSLYVTFNVRIYLSLREGQLLEEGSAALVNSLLLL